MDSSYGTTAPSRKTHRYEPVPSSDGEGSAKFNDTETPIGTETDAGIRAFLKKYDYSTRKRSTLSAFAMVTICFSIFFYLVTAGIGHSKNSSCDTIEKGYTCSPEISQFWGQYSPYFSVPSEISPEVPRQCKITFAQILSRHGARDPTSGKTAKYRELIERIQASSTAYSKEYAFIESYRYALGADNLSFFGQQQMIKSGIKYYKRYKSLAGATTPFIRSSGSDRVVESAQNWTQGFHQARLHDYRANKTDGYPYGMVIISEDASFNNTLDHGLCTSFEDGYDSTIGDSAQATWVSIFTPNIKARLNTNMPGANLTATDTIYMMDLCPFTTVADTLGRISPFCGLFTEAEWKAYDYYQSLGKYYGYGSGNPLGPTQGVGFTNELIARMTASTVEDHTSTNSTLDDDPATFPVGSKTTLYADFSHDNDMTSIFAALGLYNSTTPLLNTTLLTAHQTSGYTSSWTVPFGARAYFEKMSCAGSEEEYVRVVVNDRVLPLETCGGDELGRCRLGKFVESLSFARDGGHWDQCFI